MGCAQSYVASEPGLLQAGFRTCFIFVGFVAFYALPVFSRSTCCCCLLVVFSLFVLFRCSAFLLLCFLIFVLVCIAFCPSVFLFFSAVISAFCLVLLVVFCLFLLCFCFSASAFLLLCFTASWIAKRGAGFRNVINRDRLVKSMFQTW